MSYLGLLTGELAQLSVTANEAVANTGGKIDEGYSHSLSYSWLQEDGWISVVHLRNLAVNAHSF